MRENVTFSPEQACPRDALATGANRAIIRRACDTAILPHLPRQTACRGMLQAFVDSYDGATHRLLTELVDVIGASIADVDRPTVEALLDPCSSPAFVSLTGPLPRHPAMATGGMHAAAQRVIAVRCWFRCRTW
ncbi:hypothetical protein [Blastococcus atacamensis]|uniref:hypothetical protein n=1 Tax=Blastococcus atacamensis TaxID=2070508 RepID=UPI000CECCA99|nr:hypothetical protein [Blastococcus atacamensis]